MWRYLVLFILATSLVQADDVILFGNQETVLISDAQLIVNDRTFEVRAVSPANGSIIDRDSFSIVDLDIMQLVATIPIEFPDGLSIAFVANLTQPSIGGQTNIVLGYNNSSSGTATFYFNPNSTTYAGNWTWFARVENAISSELRNVVVKGSATFTYADASFDPNATYFNSVTAITAVNLTSNGPETRAELNLSYNVVTNAQFTNTSGSNSLVGLLFGGSVWQAGYALASLGGVGLWNNSLLGAMDFFYTPASVYREFLVNGYMNVSAAGTSPSTIPTFSSTTTSCTVLDQNSQYAVLGANISFLRNGVFIGWNTTNVSGQATLTHTINNSGVFTITCDVADEPSVFYYRGNAPQRNTSVTVTNQGPVFINGINDASDAINVTNEGLLLTFTTGANDPDSDDWYLLLCSSPGTVAGSCISTEFCRSSTVASGANASCTLNTSGLVSEANFWWAYPCDNSSDCGASDNTTSPFVVNHAPVANPFITPLSPTVGSNLTCSANATDPDSGDSVSNDYAWWLRDEAAGPWDLILGQTANQLQNSQHDSNDQIICMVSPTDVHSFTGRPTNSSSVSIAQGTLSASASLSAPNVSVLYSVTLSVSCTVTTGDSEDVTLTVEDDRTGPFTQSSTSPAAVSVNTSSISLGSVSGTSATHQVRITGETAGSYNFRARCTATDTAPLTATSASQPLTVVPDLSAPIISGIVAESTNQSFEVNWITDDQSDNLITYGTTTALGSSVFDPTLRTSHALNVTGLSESIDYYYNVTSCNTNSVCSTVGYYSVRTLGPEQAFPNEVGFFTGTFVERGPKAVNGSITKGDIYEIYLATPQGLDSQDEVTVIITVKGKQVRKTIRLPYTVKSPVTPLYP